MVQEIDRSLPILVLVHRLSPIESILDKFLIKTLRGMYWVRVYINSWVVSDLHQVKVYQVTCLLDALFMSAFDAELI